MDADRFDQRPGLIYIASTGRAGSTLLDLLLNAHSRIVGLGELHHWPQLAAHARCGCGAELRECSFWARVGERVNPRTQAVARLGHFARYRCKGRAAHDALVERLPDLLAQLRSAEADAVTREMIECYGESNASVLDACAAVRRDASRHEPEWWVDASKDPFRLWWLLESGRFRIKVVHLLRDPRAYTYSTAVRDRSSRSGYARLRAVLSYALIWRLKNAFIEEVLRRKTVAADHCRVSYEDLCRDPEGVLRRICAMLGCRFEQTMIDDFRTAVSHSVAGNHMRFEKRPITLDEHWRTAFPARDQWLVRCAAQLPPAPIEWALRLRVALGGIGRK